MSLVILHSTVLAINIYALWYDQMYVDLPLPESFQTMPFKARAIFLTFWCLILQTIYFGVALLNDIVETNFSASKKALGLRKIKDILFSLAFAVALYVGTVFWSLYSIDKKFIFPDNVEKLFPKWLNHVMHTMIIPFILIEFIFSRRNYPPRHVGISIGLLFMFGYVLWINFLYFTKNAWVYPFLNVLNWPSRILFYSFSVISGLIVYVLGEKLNSVVFPDTKTYVNGNYKQH